MAVIYLENAEKSLVGLADFVEGINTVGSGYRFLERFISKIERNITLSQIHKPCRQKSFSKRGLSCLAINGWVIAFAVLGDHIIIHEIIFGKLLHE